MDWIEALQKLPPLGMQVEISRPNAICAWLIQLANGGNAWVIYDINNVYISDLHCVKSWSPYSYQPERSKREDPEKGCGALNTTEMP